jgi:hypothetical protein
MESCHSGDNLTLSVGFAGYVAVCQFHILPLPCEVIYTLLTFIANNWEYFQTNSTVQSVNTRNKHQLHRPIINLSFYQKSTLFGH